METRTQHNLKHTATFSVGRYTKSHSKQQTFTTTDKGQSSNLHVQSHYSVQKYRANKLLKDIANNRLDKPIAHTVQLTSNISFKCTVQNIVQIFCSKIPFKYTVRTFFESTVRVNRSSLPFKNRSDIPFKSTVQVYPPFNISSNSHNHSKYEV